MATKDLDGFLGSIAPITRKQFLLDSGVLVIGFSLAGSLLSKAALAAGPPPSWVDPVPPGMSTAGLPGQAGAVDQWLAITKSGQVLVSQSQPDVGTGAITGMLQIVAEELYVPFSAVTLMPINTATSGNDGGVGGSQGVSSGGAILRVAAAQARETLLAMAAAKFGTTVANVKVKDGVISGPGGQSVTYGDLVDGKQISGTVGANVKLKPVSEYTIVGTAVPRVDIPTKVTGGTGTFNYLVNIKVPGMVHARWLKPPAYGATILSADTSAVEKMPGVVAIVPVDLSPVGYGGYNTGMVMENFQGLAVIAKTEWQAISALNALGPKVTWSTPAALSGSSTSFDYLKSLPPYVENTNLNQGDVAKGFAAAAHTFEATYTTPYLANAPIGPSTAIADVQGNKATIWSDTQNIWGTQTTVAGILGIPAANVKVISFGGSGVYGRGNSDDAPYEAAILSQRIGKPVRVQWMRQEEFQWSTCQGPKVLQLRAGLTSGGKIDTVRLDVWTDADFAGQFGGQPFITMTPRYTIANLLEKVYYAQNPLRKGLLRAVGGPSNAFAWESFIDEIAAKLGVDPLAYRLAHLTDTRQIAVLKAVAEGIGYKAHTRSSGRGIGLASFVDQLANTYVAHAAEVEVDKTTGAVQVKHIVAAIDCGLAVNPNGVKLQLEGGTIQSMSWSMKEQLVFNDHMVTSNDWISYPIVHFPDVPTLDTIVINRPEYAPTGVGEPPTLGAPAAIANAIYDATGARLRAWPMTPANVLTALKAV